MDRSGLCGRHSVRPQVPLRPVDAMQVAEQTPARERPVEVQHPAHAHPAVAPSHPVDAHPVAERLGVEPSHPARACPQGRACRMTARHQRHLCARDRQVGLMVPVERSRRHWEPWGS